MRPTTAMITVTSSGTQAARGSSGRSGCAPGHRAPPAPTPAREDLDGHRLGLGRPAEAAGHDLADHRATADPHGCGCGYRQLEGAAEPDPVSGCCASREHVSLAVTEFQGRLGIEPGGQSVEPKAWAPATAEFRDKVLGSGAEGVDVSRRLRNETFDRARSYDRDWRVSAKLTPAAETS